MHHFKRVRQLRGAFLLLVFIFSPNAFAEAAETEMARKECELETMTVTAQKKEEKALDVPGNVTAMDGLTMQDLSIEKIDELTLLAPNINIDKIDSHMTQVVFRGIGGMTNMNKVWNTNVDGVIVPYVGTDLFFDVQQVELMRGSQGSLYGRNTHAGVVNVTTRKPSEQFSLDALLEAEAFNTQKANLAFGGPIDDKQGYRLALGYTRSDGYMENEFLNTDDGSDTEQFSGRLHYELRPSDDNLIRLTLTGDSYEGGYDDFAPLDKGATHTTANDEEGKNQGHLLMPTLTWEKTFDPFTLTSITNYASSNFQTVLDQDFTQYDIMVFDYDENFDTFTQEFRFTGGKPSRVQWLVGLSMMVERMDSVSDFSFGEDAASMGVPDGYHMIGEGEIDSQGAALFGQVIVPWKKMEIRARLRLDYEQRELTWQGRNELSGMSISAEENYSRDDDWLGVMPSISLAYLIDDRQRIYGSIDRGYKVGDYAANQVDIEAVREVVDPEYTLTYEIGYKGLLANSRVEVNAAAFYIDWTDMQVSVVNNNVALMQNAADAHSYGVELEARWQALQGLDIFAGFGWLQGEFDKYDNHPDGLDLSGNTLPNTNEYTVSLGARYRHARGFFASVTGALMGPKYMDELNEVKQDSYTIVNAKIGYETKAWGAYLYGRNLLDEAYLVHTCDTAGRAGEPLVCGGQVVYYF